MDPEPLLRSSDGDPRKAVVLMLSTTEFWRLLSGRGYALRAVPELPRPLAVAAQFDRIFGDLTRHRVISLEPSTAVVIHCQGCDQASGEATDVCHSHMGLLQGLLEKETGRLLRSARDVNGDVCELRYRMEKTR